jgi:hypothetical protein
VNVLNSAGLGMALTAAAVGLLVAATISAETVGRRRTVRWLAGAGITLSCVSLAVVAVRFAAVLLR